MINYLTSFFNIFRIFVYVLFFSQLSAVKAQPQTATNPQKHISLNVKILYLFT